MSPLSLCLPVAEIAGLCHQCVYIESEYAL